MALSIPIVSEFDGKGIDKAIKEFKQLETVGEKAQFAIKKAAVPAAAALTAVAGALGWLLRRQPRTSNNKRFWLTLCKTLSVLPMRRLRRLRT